MDDLEDNIITMDKRVLLACIEANSNNFIRVDNDNDKVYVGKKRVYTTWNYLTMWVKNGREAMKGNKVKRIGHDDKF